ncbi:MAG: hypothetical protein IJ446_11285 [Oscillospiraceae bacterium]|nr:hypothetical protein [Oscillospiraceae bacterium]
MTLLSSLILSAVMFLSAPDALTQKEATETPCKENYYGYEIDMGEIAGTEVAEELNEYKTEFRDFIKYAVKNELINVTSLEERNYELPKISDIDFNDNKKISTQRYSGKYNSYEYNADYESVYNEVSDTEYWRWDMRIGDSIYAGFIRHSDKFYHDFELKATDFVGGKGYEHDILCVGNYEIQLDHTIIENNNRWSKGNVDYLSDHMKINIARLLYEKGEKSKNIKTLNVILNQQRFNCIIIFVDDKAKYICSEGTRFDLFDSLSVEFKEDTPEHIKNTLTAFRDRHFFNGYLPYESTDPDRIIKTLFPYNQIMYYMPLVMKYQII